MQVLNVDLSSGLDAIGRFCLARQKEFGLVNMISSTALWCLWNLRNDVFSEILLEKHGLADLESGFDGTELDNPVPPRKGRYIEESGEYQRDGEDCDVADNLKEQGIVPWNWAMSHVLWTVSE